MTTTFDEQPTTGRVTTSNATATDVPGLVFAPSDKTTEIYEIEATAVRQNTANPLGFYARLIYAVVFAAGVPSIIATGSPGWNVKIGDATMLAQLVTASGSTVKVQVQGLGTTTFDWTVKVRRQLWTSN